jgi:hypothetical protein
LAERLEERIVVHESFAERLFEFLERLFAHRARRLVNLGSHSQRRPAPPGPPRRLRPTEGKREGKGKGKREGKGNREGKRGGRGGEEGGRQEGKNHAAPPLTPNPPRADRAADAREAHSFASVGLSSLPGCSTRSRAFGRLRRCFAPLTESPLPGVGVAPPRERGGKREYMLRIYAVILDTIRHVRPTIEKIERRDSDLARQMRRAAASVALNTSEAMYSRLGNKKVR